MVINGFIIVDKFVSRQVQFKDKEHNNQDEHEENKPRTNNGWYSNSFTVVTNTCFIIRPCGGKAVEGA